MRTQQELCLINSFWFCAAQIFLRALPQSQLNAPFLSINPAFIQACRDTAAKNIAATILRERHTSTFHVILPPSLGIHATA